MYGKSRMYTLNQEYKNMNVNQKAVGSDHTPLFVTIDISSTNTMTAGMVMERSNCLGKVY